MLIVITGTGLFIACCNDSVVPFSPFPSVLQVWCYNNNYMFNTQPNLDIYTELDVTLESKYRSFVNKSHQNNKKHREGGRYIPPTTRRANLVHTRRALSSTVINSHRSGDGFRPSHPDPHYFSLSFGEGGYRSVAVELLSFFFSALFVLLLFVEQ
jgi:hypothetical protein